MFTSEFASHDFGSALRAIRKSLALDRDAFGSVCSPQYVGTLERSGKCPTLGMVEKIASVIGIHPLTLMTMAYSLSETNETSLEEMLSLVHSQIVSTLSGVKSSNSARHDAVDQLKKLLDKPSKRKKMVIPQVLIDRAFDNDYDAVFWFRTAGLTLVPGRLNGLPGLANVFRDKSPVSS